MNWPSKNVESGAFALGGAILSGVLQVLVFPRWSLAWLAPFCLVPLLLAVKEQRARDRWLLGWLAGSVFFGGTCYWIYPVMRDYASISPPIAAFLFVLFFLVKGVQCGAFALLGAPLLQRAWAVPGLATLWVALEGSHQYVFFTWTLLGNAAVELPLEPYSEARAVDRCLWPVVGLRAGECLCGSGHRSQVTEATHCAGPSPRTAGSSATPIRRRNGAHGSASPAERPSRHRSGWLDPRTWYEPSLEDVADLKGPDWRSPPFAVSVAGIPGQRLLL